MIRAIETSYRGYRFRSRLEARWAVFFDTLGFRWEYEKEGFDIDGTWYLPDFWLADIQCFAEVKPETFDERSYRLACNCRCLLLEGIPEVRWYLHGGMEPEVWSLSASTLTYQSYIQAAKQGYAFSGDSRAVHLPMSLWKHCPWYYAGKPIETYDNTGFLKAVYAARSARFEHGASG